MTEKERKERASEIKYGCERCTHRGSERERERVFERERV